MRTLLWLDDYRDPFKRDWLVFAAVHDYEQIVWVKNYKEFTAWIKANGLPYAINFDHDLADSHYSIPFEQWELSPEIEGIEYTGYDCAKWLVDHCMDNDLELPHFKSHSANPIGRRNIEKLLSNFSFQRLA